MRIADASAAQLETFYRGIYWEAFAAQHEPLDTWRAALRGELPYTLRVRLALEDDRPLGGVAFERYPRSGCGLVTYLVTAPEARGRGVGKALLDDALRELRDAPAVFAELNDPRTQAREPVAVARDRLERFLKWGARIVEPRYVQPRLAPGLERDTTLLLVAFGPCDPRSVKEFVDELYLVTEGAPP